MSEDLNNASSNPVSGYAPRSPWQLLRNRKIGIFTAVVILIGVGTWWVLAQAPPDKKNSNPDSNNDAAITNSSSSSSRTFERFEAIVNRPSPSNVNSGRPTKEDTAKAIQSLTNTNTP